MMLPKHTIPALDGAAEVWPLPADRDLPASVQLGVAEASIPDARVGIGLSPEQAMSLSYALADVAMSLIRQRAVPQMRCVEIMEMEPLSVTGGVA